MDSDTLQEDEYWKQEMKQTTRGAPSSGEIGMNKLRDVHQSRKCEHRMASGRKTRPMQKCMLGTSSTSALRLDMISAEIPRRVYGGRFIRILSIATILVTLAQAATSITDSRSCRFRDLSNLTWLCEFNKTDYAFQIQESAHHDRVTALEPTSINLVAILEKVENNFDQVSHQQELDARMQ